MPESTAELNERIDDLKLQLRASKANAKQISQKNVLLEEKNRKLKAKLRLARGRR